MSVEWSDPSSRDFETQHSAPRLQCNNTGILVGHQLAFMTFLVLQERVSSLEGGVQY